MHHRQGGLKSVFASLLSLNVTYGRNVFTFMPLALVQFSPFISFSESERGVDGHVSQVSVIQTRTSTKLPLFVLHQLPPIPTSRPVKGGWASKALSQVPSDRWGRRWLRCHWLTAGESAMQIGACRGTGKKTCVRRRWCLWRSCASTPRRVTARVNAARSSGTCWEVAAVGWTQVTAASNESFEKQRFFLSV